MTEQEIFAKYPEIFKEKDLPMEQTCMCWGLEVPDSWLPIIDDLCGAMQNYGYSVGNNEGRFKFPQVVAEQVKEKFGQLRFYYRLEHKQENTPKEVIRCFGKYIDGMIALAEYQISKLNEKN